ncbi:MAG: 5-bromo-4-chloroindolyl phosphate hydrolysis family protein [Lacrimispora sp.]
MDNRDFSNIGDQIRDSVQNAIDSRDFKQLNKAISDTVNFALDEARSQLVKHTNENRNGSPFPGNPSRNYGQPGGYERAEGPGYRAFQTSRSRETYSREIAKPGQPGRVAGILYTVFGGLGVGLMVFLILLVWILAILIRPAIWLVGGASLFLLVSGGGFGFMLAKGISIRERLKRAKIYVKQAGKRMYCTVEELAGNIGRSRDFVLKDIQKIIEKGIIPEAHLDDQKTCLILSDATYKQYLECQKALKERELEQKKEEETRPRSKELEQMVAAGRNYLKVLEEANDAIPGEVISQKISRLEEVVRRIFDSVLKHPEHMEEMERFMEYYLPTTVKLVTTYRDFDSVGSQGTNIAAAKEEIERTLDTINQAFERLLDDLYQDAVLDITTDASVIQTMLKKDGWTESDFTGGKKNE